MKAKQMITLKDACIFINGDRGSNYPSDNDFLDSGIPFINSKHLSNGRVNLSAVNFISSKKFQSLKNGKTKPNDILYCIRGSLGKNAIVNFEKGAIASALVILRTKPNFNTKFLYYCLNSSLVRSQEKNIENGSVQGNLSVANIKDFQLPKFDLLTQQKIASVLSALDSKIELNNRINAELEAMAKTLYDYWFVQFDFPVVTSSGAEKPYKTSGGKMVWNEDLKREIPEGWEVKLFSEWINNDKSGDWGKEQVEGNYTEKVYCIRGADINGLNGLGELKSPERYILEKNLHKVLDPADLIVEISGGSPTQSTGRLAFVTEETLARFDAPIICSNFCKAVTLKNKKHLYNFVYHWKSIYDAGVLFGYEGKTSGIKNLLFESFVSSHFTVIPDEAIVEKFYDFMEPLESKKQKNLKENQKLTELRDWLLPMLMNGQVTVNEAKEYTLPNETLSMVAEGE